MVVGGASAQAAAHKGTGPAVIQGPFCHHVYFWLANPDSQTDRDRFLKNLISFLEEVEVIQSVQVGEPAGTPRGVVDNSYTYDLIVTFKDAAAQDVYQAHPAHVRFVEASKDLWTKVIVYDSIRIWPES